MRRFFLVTLIVVCLLALSSLSFTSNAIASSSKSQSTTTVTIPATQAFTDTGIDLTQGDSVSITASGTIYIAASDPGKTPDGDPNCTADSSYVGPGLPCWSLIGWIGNSVGPFEVGSSDTFSASASGRLYLGVNDNNFGDNSGSWTATVTIGTPTAVWCECTAYVANYFGLPSTYPDAKNWPGWLPTLGMGWKQVSVPSVGNIVVFQPQFGSGIDQKHGHVGIISSVNSVNNNHNWQITVEGSNQGNSGLYTKDGCTNVNNIPFKSYPQSDTYVSYWTR